MKARFEIIAGLGLLSVSLAGCGMVSPRGSSNTAEQTNLRPIVSEDGKSITYGLYPQTYVGDPSLVSSLNTLTATESNGWYLYNGEYYAKLSATPYDSSYKFDNRTTIVSGRIYWFKCEPIIWNVLSNNSGEYYVLSSVLLDAHCYYNSTSSRTIDGKTIYANNYEYSDIRAWLNDDFYNAAFAFGNSHIKTTTVDNSVATVFYDDNPYVCDDTQDKVFLPNFKDYFDIIASGDAPEEGYCKTTDWARARGAYCRTIPLSGYNGNYWTRSPYGRHWDRAWFVRYDGWTIDDYVDYEYYSVRPAITLKIA